MDSRTNLKQLAARVGEPDFNNILAILRRERPARPTLFEFFLNTPFYQDLTQATRKPWPEDLDALLTIIHGFRNTGYDYAAFCVPGFSFPAGHVDQISTRSLNQGAVITDRASFDAYAWPDPEAADFAVLDRLAPEVPRGMKIISSAPGGVLENAIMLVGYEHLCMMVLTDEPLAFDIFENIGRRLVTFYERCLEHEIVGAIIGNDDWGFKSQTMLSPADMRRFVFPWHERIVRAAHAAGKPAILHSCGCLIPVMDDVIDDMKYDGKHSYEDIIQPVEEAYDQYHRRIAIMGGIDLDFVCRSTPEKIYQRAKRMMERAEADGAFGLGTGNSVPEYVPREHYFAMTRAVLETRA